MDDFCLVCSLDIKKSHAGVPLAVGTQAPLSPPVALCVGLPVLDLAMKVFSHCIWSQGRICLQRNWACMGVLPTSQQSLQLDGG